MLHYSQSLERFILMSMLDDKYRPRRFDEIEDSGVSVINEPILDAVPLRAGGQTAPTTSTGTPPISLTSARYLGVRASPPLKKSTNIDYLSMSFPVRGLSCLTQCL
jgi:hypothetical protein